MKPLWLLQEEMSGFIVDHTWSVTNKLRLNNDKLTSFSGDSLEATIQWSCIFYDSLKAFGLQIYGTNIWFCKDM